MGLTTRELILRETLDRLDALDARIAARWAIARPATLPQERPDDPTGTVNADEPSDAI